MQDHDQPFHRWSPFGLLPSVAWPGWAAPLLPDHFAEAGTGGTLSSAYKTAEIIDLAAYRQRRLERGRGTKQHVRVFEG